jgi:hypothetical protein
MTLKKKIMMLKKEINHDIEKEKKKKMTYLFHNSNKKKSRVAQSAAELPESGLPVPA